jgi:anti-anti-sigma factor
VDAAATGRGLVLDLSEVTFVDSSMLKELLRAATELDRYETRLVLAGVPDAVQRLLDLTRTAGLFTIAADRDAALRLVATD